MKTAAKILLPVAVLAGGVAGRNLLMATGPQSEEQELPAYVPLVEVTSLTPEDAVLEVVAQGQVRPARRVMLAPEVGGRVVHLGRGMERGVFFEAGEVLMRVDDTDARIAVATAEAQLAQAQASLELEEAQGEIARRDWEALGEGEAPAAALRMPQRRAAEAQVAAAEAALEKAQTDLARTTLAAPFAGRTVARSVELGAIVAPGQAVVDLYGVEVAEVALPIPLAQLAYLHLGLDGPLDGAPLPVELSATVGGEEVRWQATITRVEGELDPRDRMVRAIAEVRNPFAGGVRALAPGMFVRAKLAGRAVEAVVRIPRHTLRPGDQVLLVDADDRLREVRVEVLQRTVDSALVSAGLEAGDRLCLTPLALVVDGMRVQVAVAPEAGQ